MLTVTFHAKKKPQRTNLYNFQISLCATATNNLLTVEYTLPFINLLSWQVQDSRLKLYFPRTGEVSVPERNEMEKTNLLD